MNSTEDAADGYGQGSSGATLIGPRLEGESAWFRYGATVLVVVSIVLARLTLVPLLGAQAPLLPFVLGVFFSAYLGGRGPALLACVLSPLLATLCLTELPRGLQALQWGAHTLFFLGIGTLVVFLMHELQMASRRQLEIVRRAERAAQCSSENEARLRLLTDHLPVLISYVDSGETLRFANATFREWLGSDPVDPPKSLRELFGDVLYAERAPHIRSALSGELVRFEGTTRHHTRGARLCEIVYVPDRSPTGLIRGFYVMAQDITDRRHAEASLRERERLLKLVFDNASDGLCLFTLERNQQFRCVSVNESFLRVRGYTRALVQGRPARELIPEANLALTREKWLEAVQSRQALVYNEVADLPVGRRFAEITLVPIAEPNGAVTHLLAAYRDVTVQQQAQSQLREANRRKDEFLAMLAHELRNPLAPIRNVAEILSQGALDAETVRRSSQLLQRQASQLTRLVDDLLDVARITRGAIELKKEMVAIERVVEMAVESIQPLLDLKRQNVTVKRSPEAVLVEADSVRLCQIITNLLSNAAKYSPEGTRIQIELGCTQDDVFVSVRDQGIGIDPQLLPHIFELFLQGDRSLDRAQGGLGIGLTIARRLIQMHGGHIEAHSAGLGQGSEFRLQLPRLHARSSSMQTHPTGQSDEKRRRRVLVVEDNVDAAESLAMLLRMAGHEVEVAHEGNGALNALEHFAADFILLDIGLPGVDGYMVAQSIRTRFPKLRARLLALTGYGRSEDRDLALSCGFDDHLAKPVDPQHLLNRLGEDHASASQRRRLH